MLHIYALFAVSGIARAGVLSPCDGDVRVLLPEKPGELNTVFKPNDFNAVNSFYVRFLNPYVHDILCSKTHTTRTSECVVDSSNGTFYVSKRGIHVKPTKVHAFSQDPRCGFEKSSERTLHLPGTHLAPCLNKRIFSISVN